MTFSIPDEIKGNLSKKPAKGWNGIDPIDAYLSGSLYLLNLNQEEVTNIYNQYVDSNEIFIPEGIKNNLNRVRTKYYDYCAKSAFLESIKQGLKGRGFVL